MSSFPDNFQTEDAFIVDEDDWLVLPGGQGKVSPEGMVYSEEGDPLFMLYEDSESPLNIYTQEDGEEEYEWM